MSAAAVQDLVLLVTALLFIAIARALTWPPPRWLYLKPEAEDTLRDLTGKFQNELREDATVSPRADKGKKVVKRDIKAEYYRRRNWPGRGGGFFKTLRRAAAGIIVAAGVFVVAVLALPFLTGLFPVVAVPAGYAGPPLAALGVFVASTKFLDKPDGRRDALPAPVGQQRDGLALGPAGEGRDPVTKTLERYRGRVTRAARKRARSTAARERGRREGISKEEITKAWESLVIPRLDAPAPPPVRSPGMWIVSVVAGLVVAAIIYLIFVLAIPYLIVVLAIPKLSLGVLWQVGVIAASILILYGLMRVIVVAWRNREALLERLVRAASAMVETARIARPRYRTETDSIMPSDETDTISVPPSVPESPDTTTPAGASRGDGWRPPDSRNIAAGWWLTALTLVAAAAVLCVVVARRTQFTTAHRAAAAWAGLLVLVALAFLAQAILLWYQARTARAHGGPEPGLAGQTLAFRRRGLKAAIIGQDGRASTSKTQVVLWTAAIVWALVDLLLLAGAYPTRNLFTNAVTNWRPEYLVLLGLPVAAATTAKAVVASTNSGRGPIASEPSGQLASNLGLDRMYLRDPVPAGVRGFLAGVAELFTGDDGTVAWADLQYVIFTLITLAYFTAQFLARPTDGLPPVPAALLTLMGVSATGYIANKIVNTRGVNLKGS